MLPCILLSPKVHYRVQKSSPLVPIPNEINPVHTKPPYIFMTHFMRSHLCPGLPSGVFPPSFPIKTIYAYLFYTISIACPVHFAVDFIILIICGEEHRLELSKFRLCNFLQFPQYINRSFLIHRPSLH
jgi:hypothetical protein